MRDLHANLTDVLCEISRPFYSEGKGRILCPVCVGFNMAGRFRPSLHTRTSFVAHFVSEHRADMSVITIPMGSSPQLLYRTHEAFMLYIWSKVHCRNNPEGDRPEECPFIQYSEARFECYADLRQLQNPDMLINRFEESLATSATFFDGPSTLRESEPSGAAQTAQSAEQTEPSTKETAAKDGGTKPEAAMEPDESDH
jgi:hypothetical protein